MLLVIAGYWAKLLGVYIPKKIVERLVYIPKKTIGKLRYIQENCWDSCLCLQKLLI